MKVESKHMLTILNIVFWIIFIGICIKTGTLLISFSISLLANTAAAANLHDGLDLSGLLQSHRGQYITVVSSFIILLAMKAFIFYLIIKAFLKTNFEQPFNIEVYHLISRISYLSIQIAVATWFVERYISWLSKRGVLLPDVQDYVGGSSEFLLLGCIIFFIAQIFKKGIDIQSENSLTI